MAYDPDREVIVLYGGNAAGWPYENTTWEFDGADWLSITTTLSPAARHGMAMAYDSDRQVMVLFGGADPDNLVLNQTWEYTNTDWAQVSPATSPLSRTHHSLVTGPGGAIYLFGGNAAPAGAASPTYFNDLWQYENGVWTDVAPTGDKPPARARAALAYDSANNRLLLFGGRSATGALLADLWAFDLSTETWQFLDDGGGGGGPPARLGHSLTYDPALGAAVLVGGSLDNGDTRLGDTWHYQDGWSEANPATVLPPRAYHQAVDTPDGIVLFSHGEVWRYE
jgi:hypothetical protein